MQSDNSFSLIDQILYIGDGGGPAASMLASYSAKNTILIPSSHTHTPRRRPLRHNRQPCIRRRRKQRNEGAPRPFNELNGSSNFKLQATKLTELPRLAPAPSSPSSTNNRLLSTPLPPHRAPRASSSQF